MTETNHGNGASEAGVDGTTRSSETAPSTGDESGSWAGDHIEAAGTRQSVRHRARLTTNQIRRLSFLAVVTVLLGAGLGFGGALCWPPQYAARAQLLYETNTEKSSDVTREDRNIRTQLVLMRSRQVLGPVATAEGTPVEDLEKQVTFSPVESSRIIQVEARADSHGLATRRAQAIVNRYLQITIRRNPSEVDQYLRSELADVQTKLVGAHEQAERQHSLGSVVDLGGQLPAAADLQNLAARQQQLLAQLDQINLAELDTPAPVVIVPPYPVPDPVSPLPGVAAVAGAFIALAVAACVIAMRARRWTRR